ncbi:PKHB2-like protein [Mya arenaria]|uniref:PKHB2-like protein n=1 Tax=Mya arenaria TaxID=6604 RepID=A0ABY7DZT7_MYAAR|nr:PKHB2-like protein [Mya arenaria]
MADERSARGRDVSGDSGPTLRRQGNFKVVQPLLSSVKMAGLVVAPRSTGKPRKENGYLEPAQVEFMVYLIFGRQTPVGKVFAPVFQTVEEFREPPEGRSGLLGSWNPTMHSSLPVKILIANVFLGAPLMERPDDNDTNNDDDEETGDKDFKGFLLACGLWGFLLLKKCQWLRNRTSWCMRTRGGIGIFKENNRMEKQIVKAGWLQRRSSVVHRWKRCWFVLYRDGNLTRFESPDSRHPEKSLILRAVCVGLRTGAEMRDHNDDLKLCAENMDDMKAWQLTIEEARSTAGAQVPAGSQVFYPQVVSHVYGGYPGQIITQQGQTSDVGPGCPLVKIYVHPKSPPRKVIKASPEHLDTDLPVRPFLDQSDLTSPWGDSPYNPPTFE